MTVEIIQHGMMRTGTSLTRACLEMNYPIVSHVHKYGWKHGGVPLREYPARVVVSIRHPLSWLVSMHRFGSATTDLIPEFEKWILWHPRHHRGGDLTELHCWSFCYGYWLARIPDAMVVRFEDMLTRPRETCDCVAAELDLPPCGNGFQVPEKYVGARAQKRTDGYAEIVKREIVDRAYMAAYTPEMIAHVRARLDPLLLERFGYDC